METKPERLTAAVYDKAFYADNVQGSLSSARAVVPIILELMPVRSAVDFGCGMGTWLCVFQEHGVDTVLGIDGGYVDRSGLLIDPALFLEHDLEQPIALARTYDLAISLEVGEHLRTASSRSFVESLTRAAPVVLFSAGIPGQGGTHHINEQWPEFWRDHFRSFGYQRLDLVRPRICLNRDVEWWYRQNIFLYSSGSACDLGRAVPVQSAGGLDPLELINARIFARFKTVSGLSLELLSAVRRSMGNRISRAIQSVRRTTP